MDLESLHEPQEGADATFADCGPNAHGICVAILSVADPVHFPSECLACFYKVVYTSLWANLDIFFPPKLVENFVIWYYSIQISNL